MSEECVCGHSARWHQGACNYGKHAAKCQCKEFRTVSEHAELGRLTVELAEHKVLAAQARRERDVLTKKLEIEHFVVKHYTAEEGPVIKGNGFDGLRIGEDREEAEDFVKWVNARLYRITRLEGALSSELNQRSASDMAEDLAHEGDSGVSGSAPHIQDIREAVLEYLAKLPVERDLLLGIIDRKVTPAQRDSKHE